MRNATWINQIDQSDELIIFNTCWTVLAKARISFITDSVFNEEKNNSKDSETVKDNSDQEPIKHYI
jgi:4-diphosphocytidyl-2C-methyl-D-erythritol kinase